MVVYTKLFVGQVCHIAGAVIHLGDVGYRDVTQVLSRTVKVAGHVARLCRCDLLQH